MPTATKQRKIPKHRPKTRICQQCKKNPILPAPGHWVVPTNKLYCSKACKEKAFHEQFKKKIGACYTSRTGKMARPAYKKRMQKLRRWREAKGEEE